MDDQRVTVTQAMAAVEVTRSVLALPNDWWQEPWDNGEFGGVNCRFCDKRCDWSPDGFICVHDASCPVLAIRRALVEFVARGQGFSPDLDTTPPHVVE